MRTVLLVLAFCLLTAFTTHATNTESDADKLLEAERLAAERLFWESVKDSQDPQDLQAYLDAYPQGHYAPLARNRLDRLTEPAPEELMVEAAKLIQAANEMWTEKPWTEGVALDVFLGALLMQPQSFRVPQTPEQIKRVRELETVFRGSLGLIEEALVLLQEIMDRHPASDLAVQLITGQAVGDVSIEALREIATQLREALPIAEQALGQAQSEKTEADCYSSPTADCILGLVLEMSSEVDDTGSRGQIGIAPWSGRGVLHDIAIAQAGSGNITGAVQLAKGIDHAGLRAQALHGIAIAQVESGDIVGALETVKGIDDAGSRTDALVSIAAAQVKAGDHGAAGETLTTALETVKGIDGAGSRTDALVSIAAAQVKAGDHGAAGETLTTALETVKGIDGAGSRTDALVSIAAAQVKAGDHGAAGETLTTALETAKGADDAGSRANALVSIAAAQVKAGRPRRGGETLTTA